MDSKTLREKYLKFFEDRGHKRIDGAPLVLKDDPTTLFTSSGMQPLVPYLLGAEHPQGQRVVDAQRCFRGTDIEEVGDSRHDTFFEMLGNWSFGDYFKKEQIPWIFEFLIKEVGLDPNRLHVSVFSGNVKYSLPKDNESFDIWKSLGIPEERIHFYGIDKNWWSRFPTPEDMPEGEPGGPDSEMFYEFPQVEHDPKFGEKCDPHCDCGHFVEIGNNVFMQYKKQGEGFIELPNKNVDYGGGLERLVMDVQDQPDMFRTDLFWPLIDALQQFTAQSYEIETNRPAMRIIADHIKAAVFLTLDGVTPSNKSHGYLLRRLLRRAGVKLRSLTGDMDLALGFSEVVMQVFNIYELDQNLMNQVNQVISAEMIRFSKTLDKGLKEFDSLTKDKKELSAKEVFFLYETYGFPYELTLEMAQDSLLKIPGIEEFNRESEKHRELSRTSSAGMFKGGLQAAGEMETKYHTATHLLQAALRQVLGEHVVQRGSNITQERLRFDFSHPQKLTESELKQVEDLVNQKIKEDLPVTHQEMDKVEAEKTGAIHAFGEKYGQVVTIYTIGEFSREFCGGPHVEHTGSLGNFKIQKEESAGAGIRRIYATLS